jgi:rRNA maturation protein Rpf1
MGFFPIPQEVCLRKFDETLTGVHNEESFMYTTSRYSSKKTRDFAKKLAAGESVAYVARGKKTIDELVILARKNGEERIGIIEEKEDAPHKLVTITVMETGRWEWGGERLLTA